MLAFIREAADDTVAVFKQGYNRDLHIDLDSLMDSVILESSDKLEARAIADVSKARITMPAKISLQYLAVFCPVEDGSPGL